MWVLYVFKVVHKSSLPLLNLLSPITPTYMSAICVAPMHCNSFYPICRFIVTHRWQTPTRVMIVNKTFSFSLIVFITSAPRAVNWWVIDSISCIHLLHRVVKNSYLSNEFGWIVFVDFLWKFVRFCARFIHTMRIITFLLISFAQKGYSPVILP